MTEQDPTHDSPPEADETYEEFELDDDRLVVYDADNPDAWLASDARTSVHR
jgi:hypothetical protein